MEFSILIPTKNSAPRVATLIHKYRQIGVEPLFIYDTTSEDNTLDILQTEHACFYSFNKNSGYAENGMIEFGSAKSKCNWILRLDDDEFPSISLINWIKYLAEGNGYDAWSISRREIINLNNSFYYTKWPSRFGVSGNYKNFNNQLRLFNKQSISFTQSIHSTGILCREPAGIATSNHFFVHMNCLIRTPRERLEKIRHYAQYNSDLSWSYVDEYLPELFPMTSLNLCNEGLDEFSDIFHKFMNKKIEAEPVLSYEELTIAFKQVSRWLLETHNLALIRLDEYENTLSNPKRLISIILTQYFDNFKKKLEALF